MSNEIGNLSMKEADRFYLMLKNVKKSFTLKSGVKRLILNDVSVNMKKGEWIAIQGPSGSGKTTLLNIIYGSVSPDDGSVIIDGVDITKLTGSRLQYFRRTKMGIILQENVLLPHLTALENVLFPAYHAGLISRDDVFKRANQLLELMGLEDKKHQYPAELSGGEQQRVAIARALVLDPPIIIADEPTGQLDLESTENILNLLARFHQQGLTIIMVTHSSHVAKNCETIYSLKNGQLVKIND